MISNKVWILLGAVLAVSCSMVDAREKRIRLEDIEQDNLKSEADLMTRGQYLKPPSINAEQTADYGPSEEGYNPAQKQYAVEEDSSTETPEVGYASNTVYLSLDKDLAQQASSTSQGQLQTTYLGYVPAMAMHLVYLPQMNIASGSQATTYPSQYHKNVPTIVYQPIVQDPYVSSKNTALQYQTDKGYSKAAAATAYIQVPESETQHSSDYQQTSNYVLVPQNYQPEQQTQLVYEKYAERQPISAYEKYSAPQYKYSTYANPQQYVLEDTTIADNHLYSQNDQAPSAPYKTITPKYIPTPKQVTKISPPAVAFLSSTSEKAGETPKVLSEHAHGISRPVYSHISGKLVQDNSNSYNQNSNSYNQNSNSYIQNSHSYNQNGYNGHSYYYPTDTSVHKQSSYYGGFKPKSLLESYIPSSLQIEYLKRGLSKEPLATYDIIANSRNFRFENGFLPNQLYPTGNGGVVYEHYKRSTAKKVV